MHEGEHSGTQAVQGAGDIQPPEGSLPVTGQLETQSATDIDTEAAVSTGARRRAAGSAGARGEQGTFRLEVLGGAPQDMGGVAAGHAPVSGGAARQELDSQLRFKTPRAKLIDGLHAQNVRHQFRTVLAPGRAAQSLAEHRAIVDALATGDGDAAEAAMRNHLAHVVETLRSLQNPR